MCSVNLVGEDVQQHLTVTVCLEVSVEKAATAVEHLPAFICVGQITIVNQVDTQGTVHKKGLCFLC